ncbi:MAG: DUF308 domain-containing protein [Merdibacter sp.]
MMRWFNGSDDYIREYVSCWNRSCKKRVINVLAGLVLIAAGVLCVLFPVDVYQVVQWIMAGGVLVFYAVFQLVEYFSMTDYFRDLMLLPIALIALLLGIASIMAPYLSAVSVVFLGAVVLLFTGAQKISLASGYIFRITRAYSMTFCGVMSVIAALLLFIMPMVGVVLLNVMIAAFLIVSGVTLLIEAICMRKINL